jgi:hypothetical protein
MTPENAGRTKALKIIGIIFLAVFIMGRVASLARPYTSTPTVSAQREPEGVSCTTIVNTDDYRSTVCKNTIGWGTTYTMNDSDTSGSGSSSFERISKEYYENRLAWHDCMDDADTKNAQPSSDLPPAEWTKQHDKYYELLKEGHDLCSKQFNGKF